MQRDLVDQVPAITDPEKEKETKSFIYIYIVTKQVLANYTNLSQFILSSANALNLHKSEIVTLGQKMNK